ncbi:MAG: tyrosine-protein phosphatase [Bariatricus sp.]|nr:tyrosine-protein phosphatase [Bariatricus sp.]
MKKVISLLMTVVMMLGLSLPAYAEDTSYPTIESGVREIQKYGNIVLDVEPKKLQEAGYDYGDILAVTIDGKTYQIPFCTNYSDVDAGSYVVRDNNEDLIIAINMGDFATTNGIAEKITAEDKSFTWVFPDGKSIEDVMVSISMGEKGGYHDQYLIHQLVRTNDRADYDSDQIFANFRNIAAGGLGKNALFRSSSPINNEFGRAAYADNFVEANGIQTVMNLANSDTDIADYIAQECFDSPYYAFLYQNGKVKALNLSLNFVAEDFKNGLAEGLRFFITYEGPYLVHCDEGKDRAGFVSALLSCFMGASYYQVVEDYMQTYINYYHLEKGSEQYIALKNSNIDSTLRMITGFSDSTDLTKADLTAAANQYMKSIGLSDAECEALRANLAKDYETEDESASGEAPATYTVVPGDCLWNISRRLYGTGTRWKEIYEANRETIRNPRWIYIGQVLKIPTAPCPKSVSH